MLQVLGILFWISISTQIPKSILKILLLISWLLRIFQLSFVIKPRLGELEITFCELVKELLERYNTFFKW